MVRLLMMVLGLAILPFSHAAEHVVYGDGFENGWENWSWAGTEAVSSPAHQGSTSLQVSADAWEAAYFHHSSIEEGIYTNLSFWIHGGPAGGQRLLVQGIAGGAARDYREIGPLPANTWTEVTVSLEELGVANDPGFDGFWIQDRSGTTQQPFYLDEIALIPGGTPNIPTNSAVAISVDAASNRRAISELIYGVAFASAEQLQELNSPLNRSGGNPESRYNWKLNAHNRGFDWYFESLADESPNPGAEGDEFIMESKEGGAEPMLTIPMMGWVAKLGPDRERLASFSIAKYGPQTDRDWQWFPDAGNGISSANNQQITNNDPNDANVFTDSTFQQDWMRHLTNRWGRAGEGGLRYYIMDNEPSIWHATHRDVIKTGLRMGELRDLFIDYATKVREVDPNSVIVGPEEWGWSGYIYSGYDQQWGSRNGWGNLPDRNANGGMDYLPWFLDQMRQHEERTGERLLDVFTVHYYPQGGEYSETASSAMQARRNRSTRSLWDPNYQDESWISDRVRLIPRLKEWVNQYYPGLKIGITEYSWGADGHINGATAQADILGIFGREGLDIANRWVVPATGTPAFKSIQMYRNYDGAKSTFGDTSVAATVPNPDNLSAFAAVRSSDRAMTVMVINKVAATTPVSISLANFKHGGTASVWRLDSSNEISRQPDLTITGGTLTNTLPGPSISLFVIPGAEVVSPAIRVLEVEPAGAVQLQTTGDPTVSYEIERSADLKEWEVVASAYGQMVTRIDPVPGAYAFFRAVHR